MVSVTPDDLPDADVAQAFELAEFARHGALPLPGGVLEQAAPGLAAIRCVWAALAAAREA